MFGEDGIPGTIEKLEKEKRAIMERPTLALEDDTKKLMRRMRKLAWKKRKVNGNTK